MLFAGLEALGPRTLGISVGGMTDHQLHFSVLTSSQSMRGGLRIPSLSSWLGLSEDHPPPRSPPRVTELLHKMCLVLSSLRKSQGFYELWAGNGDEDQSEYLLPQITVSQSLAGHGSGGLCPPTGDPQGCKAPL